MNGKDTWRQERMAAAKLDGTAKIEHHLAMISRNTRAFGEACVSGEDWSDAYIAEMWDDITGKAAELHNRIDWMDADDRAQDMALAMWLRHKEDTNFGNQTLAYQLQAGLHYHEPKQRDEQQRNNKREAFRVEEMETPDKVAALGHEPDMDAAVEMEITQDAILDALASLPERQRVVMVQRHIFGKNVRQIAKDTGWNYNSCLTYAAKARKALAAALMEFAPPTADGEPFVQGRGRMVILANGEQAPDGYEQPFTAEYRTCNTVPALPTWEPAEFEAEALGTVDIDWTIGSTYPLPPSERKNLPEPSEWVLADQQRRRKERWERVNGKGTPMPTL